MGLFYLRILCFVVSVGISFGNLAEMSTYKQEQADNEKKSVDDQIDMTLLSRQQEPCDGQMCLYGNRKHARRLLQQEVGCESEGCILRPQTSDFNEELDSAEYDSYGIEYNNINDVKKREACKGQMCWFRGKRENSLTQQVRERLQAQLSFLRNLNRAHREIKERKRAESCTGQMCWFRGKRGKITKKSGLLKRASPCVGQMCWFRGKREEDTNKKELNPCVGQMCWFRGKKEMSKIVMKKREDMQNDKSCTGQMCWFRGRRNENVHQEQRKKEDAKESPCTGQMCWFRGRKEVSTRNLGCKGQMCWFRGKRQSGVGQKLFLQ